MQTEQMEQDKKPEKPKSIVLEVQSLLHVTQTQFQPAKKEVQDNGQKH